MGAVAKHNGVVKPATPLAKHGGQWRPVQKALRKQDGEWVEIFSSGPVTYSVVVQPYMRNGKTDIGWFGAEWLTFNGWMESQDIGSMTPPPADDFPVGAIVASSRGSAIYLYMPAGSERFLFGKQITVDGVVHTEATAGGNPDPYGTALFVPTGTGWVGGSTHTLSLAPLEYLPAVNLTLGTAQGITGFYGMADYLPEGMGTKSGEPMQGTQLFALYQFPLDEAEGGGVATFVLFTGDARGYLQSHNFVINDEAYVPLAVDFVEAFPTLDDTISMSAFTLDVPQVFTPGDNTSFQIKPIVYPSVTMATGRYTEGSVTGVGYIPEVSVGSVSAEPVPGVNLYGLYTITTGDRVVGAEVIFSQTIPWLPGLVLYVNDVAYPLWETPDEFVSSLRDAVIPGLILQEGVDYTIRFGFDPAHANDWDWLQEPGGPQGPAVGMFVIQSAANANGSVVGFSSGAQRGNVYTEPLRDFPLIALETTFNNLGITFAGDCLDLMNPYERVCLDQNGTLLGVVPLFNRSTDGAETTLFGNAGFKLPVGEVRGEFVAAGEFPPPYALINQFDIPNKDGANSSSAVVTLAVSEGGALLFVTLSGVVGNTTNYVVLNGYSHLITVAQPLTLVVRNGDQLNYRYEGSGINGTTQIFTAYQKDANGPVLDTCTIRRPAAP